MRMHAKMCLLTGVLWVTSAVAQAMDLKQVYEKALRNDPQYLAARQDMMALAEVYPQALAQLLPNVGLNASRNSVNLTKVDSDVSTQLDYLSLNNSIVVRQALYRKPQFAQLQQASVQQKSLVFIEEKAGADLVLRVTNAYFDALYAVDTYAQLQATVDAAQQQLRAARRIFESGQGTRTDVDEAQARADQAQAQWLMAKQNLTYTQRQLAMLVGEKVTPSAMLRSDLPWSSTAVDSPDKVVQALTHNPDIQLAKVKLETAELEVRKNQAGHWPTLDLVAQRSISKSENTQFPFTDYYTNQVGVQLNIPLYARGAVGSGARGAARQAPAAGDSSGIR
jgi:outer membrane protein/protease secretion system outer membrane protein